MSFLHNNVHFRQDRFSNTVWKLNFILRNLMSVDIWIQYTEIELSMQTTKWVQYDIWCELSSQRFLRINFRPVDSRQAENQILENID